jgi:ureidoacrylate peracid hydrolase
LNVLDGEPVIEKARFSALLQGSSTLDAYLQEHGLDTRIITGCLTDVCCGSTARDAMMLNYRAIM